MQAGWKCGGGKTDTGGVKIDVCWKFGGCEAQEAGSKVGELLDKLSRWVLGGGARGKETRSAFERSPMSTTSNGQRAYESLNYNQVVLVHL